MAIQWHPAFYAGMELEFKSFPVDFEKEYELTRGPLAIDLLIIKKLTDEKIDNEIGNIFRRYNIMEMKSPDDELSIDVFYKVYAYACLYKCSGETVDEISAQEITVSLYRDKYPRKLISNLNATGFTVRKEYPGIYYVAGNTLFPTQIIVSGELNPSHHSALRILTNKARKEDIITFAKTASMFTDQGDLERADSILQVSTTANKELYEKIYKEDETMCQALMDIMKDDIDKKVNQGMQQGMQQGIQQGMQQGIQQGMQQGIQQGMQQGSYQARREALKSLMENLHFTPVQAMDALSIPADDRPEYLKYLSQ